MQLLAYQYHVIRYKDLRIWQVILISCHSQIRRPIFILQCICIPLCNHRQLLLAQVLKALVEVCSSVFPLRNCSHSLLWHLLVCLLINCTTQLTWTHCQSGCLHVFIYPRVDKVPVNWWLHLLYKVAFALNDLNVLSN